MFATELFSHAAMSEYGWSSLGAEMGAGDNMAPRVRVPLQQRTCPVAARVSSGALPAQRQSEALPQMDGVLKECKQEKTRVQISFKRSRRDGHVYLLKTFRLHPSETARGVTSLGVSPACRPSEGSESRMAVSGF